MILRFLFFLIVVRPLIFIILGLNVRGREHLPKKGPAILVANHNSHLDAAVLMALFPFNQLNRIRPVAATDYFLRTKWFAWFTINIMHIIPMRRTTRNLAHHLFDGPGEALKQGEILLWFPEGSRGEPEKVSRLKPGIYHFLKEFPNIPVYPVFMCGMGRALPKDDPFLIPFICDVFIGKPLYWVEKEQRFMEQLETEMNGLLEERRLAG